MTTSTSNQPSGGSGAVAPSSGLSGVTSAKGEEQTRAAEKETAAAPGVFAPEPRVSTVSSQGQEQVAAGDPAEGETSEQPPPVPVAGDAAEDGKSPKTGAGGADADKVFQMNVAGERDDQMRITPGRPDAFRHKFLQKLSYERIWVPQRQRPPQHQTVIIFDWDDTLLCTSYLNLRLPTPEIPGHVQKQLLLLERVGAQLLELAMKLGQTFIITNAMKGWVEYSASKYVPRLLPTLQKLTIISARGNYEHAFPGNYGQWKIEAFLEVQRQLNSQIITNLVSLGDSNMEMEAVHVMGKEFAQALIKTIKFRESPTPEELVKQLELVAQKFEKIILNARNLKIGLERKWSGDRHKGSGATGAGGQQQAAGGGSSNGGSQKGADGRKSREAAGSTTGASRQEDGRKRGDNSAETSAQQAEQEPGSLNASAASENSATGQTSLHNQMLADMAAQQKKPSAGASSTSTPSTSTATASPLTQEKLAKLDDQSAGGAPAAMDFSKASDGSSVCEAASIGGGACSDSEMSPRGPVLNADQKNKALLKAGFSSQQRLTDVPVGVEVPEEKEGTSEKEAGTDS
eukprot:g12766.t1